MVSQASAVDTCRQLSGQPYHYRLVSGTSVVATILLSSIGPRAIPGATSLAGKSTLLYGSVI